MPAPSPAASPARAFATAISKIGSPDEPRSAARNAFAAAMPAAAVWPASKASWCWIAWKLPMGRPNCLRSPAYRVAWVSADSSAPAICADRTRAP
jgi:hypothetical protein